MGEIFEYVLPDIALDWTGERLTTAVGGQIEIEHLHRYLLAREFCRGLDVLDVASGEGYGTALLAQVARSAVGVEISADAAGHAAAHYRSPNLRYLQGDARKLPLPDASIDVVTSFETIEHFYEQDDFLAEVRRVLRPGGRLIVSSPDRDVYSPLGTPANTYHKRELSRSEFEILLRRHFSHIRLVCQRPILGSIALSDDGDPGPTITIERRDPKHFERSDGVSRAPYLIAVASDEALQRLPNSIFVQDSEIGPLIARAAEHESLRTALTETLRRAESAEAAFHASREEIAKHMSEAALQATEGLRLSPTQTESQLQQERDSLKAERDAALADLRQACLHRDMARLALRRAALFRDTAWQTKFEVAEARASEWKGRYEGLRSTLEQFLFRSGLFRASRLVPRSIRRFIRIRLLASLGS